jgi:hypothetical protein
VHDVIDVDEYGLALEDLVGILAQANAPVTDQERADMLGLARRTQMEDLVPRVLQCCRRTGKPAPLVMGHHPELAVLSDGAAPDQDGAQKIALVLPRAAVRPSGPRPGSGRSPRQHEHARPGDHRGS